MFGPETDPAQVILRVALGLSIGTHTGLDIYLGMDLGDLLEVANEFHALMREAKRNG